MNSSGIAIALWAELLQERNIPATLTKAGFMHGQIAMLQALGPRPPWWRPFARLRRRRMVDAILSITYDEVQKMFSAEHRRSGNHLKATLRVVPRGDN